MRGTHFIALQIESLARIVDFEQDGIPVAIEGFSLRKAPRRPYAITSEKNIRYQDITAIGRSEPRIELLARQIKSILTVADLFACGKKIVPTGFRLKRVSDWKSVHHDNRDPYFAVLKYLSWPCRTNCTFCLHKGDPPGFYSKSPHGWKTDIEEIWTRLKYWEPENKKALPSKSEYNFFEVITHPKFEEIARKVRAKTDRTINIVTSGCTLTKQTIEMLRSLEPVFLGVSLNSRSFHNRRTFMRDRNPDIAISSLSLLLERKVRFFISLVASDPGQLDDLADTIQWVDQFNPYFIRLNLDAHTQYSPVREDLQSSIRRWKAVVSRIRQIRTLVSTPIIFQPALFEERFFPAMRNRVLIEGVIRNSPAWAAGLRATDEIMSINGIPVAFRTFARDILNTLSCLNVKEFRIEFMRDGEKMLTIVRTAYEDCYPYRSSGHPVFSPFGIMVRGGLDVGHIIEIRAIADSHGAENVLFLTSYLMKPLLQELIENTDVFSSGRMRIFLSVPANTSFLGGNIILGDLLVVDDFVKCVRLWMKRTGEKPDVIIVPSTPFNRWDRDLMGKPFHEIERTIGIPVEMIRCNRIESIN